MSWTLTTSGAAKAKAGVNGNATLISADGGAAILDKWSDQAEGRVMAECRRDWVGSYADLSDAIKQILDDVASSYVAKQIVNYDQSGYFFGEAQTILNVQDDIARSGTNILKDFKSTEIKTPNPNP